MEAEPATGDGLLFPGSQIGSWIRCRITKGQVFYHDHFVDEIFCLHSSVIDPSDLRLFAIRAWWTFRPFEVTWMPGEIWESARASCPSDTRDSHHFVAVDVIAGSSPFVWEKGNIDRRHLSTNQPDASLVEYAVDVHPSIPRTDMRCLLLLGQRDLLESLD